MFYLFINDDSYIIVCALYRCFVCVFAAVMDKGQGGPPSKRRKTSRIRKPSRRAVENAQNASDPDIDNDNEVTHSLNTPDTVPLNNGLTQTINSGSVAVSSSTSVPTGSTLNNTDLMSMLNVAVPLITQTVVTVLQQSGLIPKSSGQTNPAVRTEVINTGTVNTETSQSVEPQQLNQNSNSNSTLSRQSQQSNDLISTSPGLRTMSGPATASSGIVETQQMDVHSSTQLQLSSSKQSSSGAASNIMDPASVSSINSPPHLSVVNNLMQPGTSSQSCNSCNISTVGLSRPLTLGISAKLKAQIWSNEFVEFEELLKSDKKKVKYVPEEKGDEIAFVKRNVNSVKITNMTQWLAAFHIFVAVYSEKYPMEAPRLMKYAETITSLSQKASVEAALEYDHRFRVWREENPGSLPWDSLNSDLHNEALATGLESKKNQKSGGPFRPNSGRPKNGGQFKRHCYTYNNEGLCRDRTCKYGHFCQLCRQEGHGKKDCHNNRTQSTRNKSTMPTSTAGRPANNQPTSTANKPANTQQKTSTSR